MTRIVIVSLIFLSSMGYCCTHTANSDLKSGNGQQEQRDTISGKINCDELYRYFQSIGEGDSLDLNFYIEDLTQKANEGDCIKLMTLLGEEYMNGSRVLKNEEKGLKMLLYSFDKGDMSAKIPLLKYYFSKRYISNYLALLPESKANDRCDLCYEKAHFLLTGTSFLLGNPAIKYDTLNTKEGIEALHNCVDCKNIYAQIDLGFYYSEGLHGLGISNEKAIYYYTEAYKNPMAKSIPGIKDDIAEYLEEVGGRVPR